jgi:hypothetical protein
MFFDLLQVLITSSAIFLGFTYVIGGLIVNLNLSRRGVVEFQILKVKYLVVGLVFLLHSIGVFAFATLPAFGLLYFSNHIILMQFINLFSMLSAISLILIWARMASGSQSFFATWAYWFIASAIGASFPMLVFIRQLLAPSIEITWIIISAQAALTAALTFLAQIYHYSAFYYGKPSSLGTLDPIGIGVPSRVRFACKPEISSLLKNLGLEIGDDNISQELFLIDETDKHYIFGFERLPGKNGNARTIKVNKEIIQAILFVPDHMKRVKSRSKGRSVEEAEAKEE